MSEEPAAPTNEELRTALAAIAYDQTRRPRANTCYAAAERIYQLAEALKTIRATAFGVLMAEEHQRLEALKTIVRIASEGEAP